MAKIIVESPMKTVYSQVGDTVRPNKPGHEFHGKDGVVDEIMPDNSRVVTFKYGDSALFHPHELHTYVKGKGYLNHKGEQV